MSVKIYYFTGTGNSLVVARRLAEKLGGETVAIASAMDREAIDPGADVVGIVFPVYFIEDNCIPMMVERFVGKLTGIEGKYVFAVSTYGGGMIATMKYLRRMVSNRGGELAAGFGVRMPNNTSAISDVLRHSMYKGLDKQLDAMVRYVKLRKRGKYSSLWNLVATLFVLPQIPKFKRDMIRRMQELTGETGSEDFEEMYFRMDKSMRISDKCNGCGICAKVCPASNIVIEDGKPQWQHRCENCVACLNWCPNGAISSGLTEYRYCHPDVKLSEMVYRK